MSGGSDRSRLATTTDPWWWSLRVALLLSFVLAGFVGLHGGLTGGAEPRWSAVASCVVPEGAAVRRIATTVDPSWCAASPVRRDDPRPPGSVVVAFLLPAEAGSVPRVRDVGIDPVGRQLFLAYDPAGDPVESEQRVAVFVALMPDELPGESFAILDSSGAVQVQASR
jgi:hypothetical protein